jgi:phage-related baseplate assembly protein
MNTPTTASHNRLIANLLKQGNIAQADAARGLVRVQHGDLLTDWLPYFVPFAGGVSVHRVPSVGENCLVLAPSGEIANGLVLCGLASNQHPQPSTSPDETVIRFPDNAQFSYNHNSGSLKISGTKTIQIEASESITFDTPKATFTGKVIVQNLFTFLAGLAGSNSKGGAAATITGDVKHTQGNLTSNGITLHTHTHKGDSGGTTGSPQ